MADWHHRLGSKTPTLRAHAHGLLKAIVNTAIDEDECLTNPCRVRGASTRATAVRPASLNELAALVSAMAARYRVMTMLAAWCVLRFGELTELRRRDIDLDHGVVRVRRVVARTEGEVIVGTPKSEAGRRDVAIPPHLVPLVREHLGESVAGGRDGLLFPAVGDPGKHLAPATPNHVFCAARESAGRPDLRWYDLPHTGSVLAASTGATLAELMDRPGHSTPQAAMRYLRCPAFHGQWIQLHSSGKRFSNGSTEACVLPRAP